MAFKQIRLNLLPSMMLRVFFSDPELPNYWCPASLSRSSLPDIGLAMVNARAKEKKKLLEGSWEDYRKSWK